MDPPPSSASTADPLSHLPSAASKLRLMCSYGGHILPRPQGKSLFYAGGETRIVALDRRTNGACLSALSAHLSRLLYNNRPFHLKYLLPNEDLDSLISVITDEDLQNMLEEHDRISAITSATPSRIRLFLFPIKPESLGSVLLDPKADSWFSDALKNARIVQKGQSADSGMGRELLGLDIVGGSDSNASLDAQGEGSSNGGEAKEIGSVPETLVLETSSSFGSTSSSISMSNVPAIGIQYEDSGMGLLEKKVRVPSSASIDSDNSVGSAGFQPKTGIHQEPHIQVASGMSSYTVGMETSLSDPPSAIHMQKTIQLSGYQLSHQSDGKQQQYELQYVQGGSHFMPQCPSGPLPLASYYKMYQIPMHQQTQSPYLLNQPCPVYFVPVKPNQNYNLLSDCSLIDNANLSSNRPPLHPQAGMYPQPVAYREVITGQQRPESVTKPYQTVPAATPVVGVPSTQGKQQFIESLELQHLSQPLASSSVASSNYTNEFDVDPAYTPIYKTQPPAPVLPVQHSKP